MSKNPQRTQGKVLYPGILRDCKQSSCYGSFMAHSGPVLPKLGPKVTSDSRKVGQNTQILANSVLKHSWS